MQRLSPLPGIRFFQEATVAELNVPDPITCLYAIRGHAIQMRNARFFRCPDTGETSLMFGGHDLISLNKLHVNPDGPTYYNTTFYKDDLVSVQIRVMEKAQTQIVQHRQRFGLLQVLKRHPYGDTRLLSEIARFHL